MLDRDGKLVPVENLGLEGLRDGRVLAVVLHQLQRYDDAVVQHHASLAAEPDHLDTRFNLALVLTAAERDEEALEAFEAVLASPDHGGAHACAAGRALAHQLGEVERGRAALRDCGQRGESLGDLDEAFLDGRAPDRS